jgi:hypothetical protein
MLEDAEVVNLVHRVAVFLGSAEAFWADGDAGDLGIINLWGPSGAKMQCRQ